VLLGRESRLGSVFGKRVSEIGRERGEKGMGAYDAEELGEGGLCHWGGFMVGCD
jgi:hypothetical protein